MWTKRGVEEILSMLSREQRLSFLEMHRRLIKQGNYIAPATLSARLTEFKDHQIVQKDGSRYSLSDSGMRLARLILGRR